MCPSGAGNRFTRLRRCTAGVLRLRGAELSLQVPEIVQSLHTAMKGITNEQTLNGTLHSLRTLTAHHLVLVADQILTFQLPHDECVAYMSLLNASPPPEHDPYGRSCARSREHSIFFFGGGVRAARRGAGLSSRSCKRSPKTPS